MEAKLLIVEDEPRLRASLQEYFEREGFDVRVAEDGAAALATLGESNPNLLILDVRLPHVDGLEVCRVARQKVGQAIGIIMISGIKKELVDQVIGLEIGADVYLTKPFETWVLLAQVRALLRRLQSQPNRGEAQDWLVIDDDLRIHFERQLVEAKGQEVKRHPVKLTRLEFKLLKYLAQHSDKACSRADLIDEVWEYAETGAELSDAAVNTCVAKLRAKIEPDPANPRYIQSVHGFGYRFKPL